MRRPIQIVSEINRLIGRLTEIGLAADQNHSFSRDLDANRSEVTFGGAKNILAAFKEKPYTEIYNALVMDRAFNLRMLDGALIQMMYVFFDENLERHRLAFFPSPHLEGFQVDPEMYLKDEIYADAVGIENIVPIPIRFDYDIRAGIPKELVHPKSHLTLGKYQNCRIPVTSPLTPHGFMDFIIRNFYNTNSKKYTSKIFPPKKWRFNESIFPADKQIIHVKIPA